MRSISHKLQPQFIFFGAGLVSLLFSILGIWNCEIINPDGICYLQSAKTFSTSFYAAAHLCDQAKWPFYSGIIYFLSHVLHISIPYSAYCINSLLTLISILCFVGIIQFISNEPRILFFAALTILCAHEFNLLRPDIIRDHGFWAFYLLSILFLLHFLRQFSVLKAVGWNLSLLAAALFRVEAVIFMLLIPFIVFFDKRESWQTALKNFFQLNLLSSVICCSMVIWLTFHPNQELSRLQEVYHELTSGWYLVYQSFIDQANSLSTTVAMTSSAQDRYFLLSCMLIMWYITKVIANVSLFFFIIILYAWYKKSFQSPAFIKLAVISYILINIIITSIFFVEHSFLAKRYLIALSLVLMIWVPFGLEDLYQRNKRWITFSILTIMIITSTSAIAHMVNSKKYLREAGTWLAQNINSDDKIFSNDYQLLFYTNHLNNDIFKQPLDITYLNDKNISHFNYVAVRVLKSEPRWTTRMNVQAVKIFANKRGDEVVIYKVLPKQQIVSKSSKTKRGEAV